MLSYFRPRDGNPFVLAWFCLVFAEWILVFTWIFFFGGAKFLASHPGFTRYDVKSAAAVKVLCCLMIIGGVIGFMLMWNLNIPELDHWTK